MYSQAKKLLTQKQTRNMKVFDNIILLPSHEWRCLRTVSFTFGNLCDMNAKCSVTATVSSLAELISNCHSKPL